jgi:hypothetical protein
VTASTRQRGPSVSDEDGYFGNLWSRPLQIAKAIAALVTFAATISGLIFGLWPALKPAESPATKGATLSNATVDHVSFGQYLDRVTESRSPYRAAQLQRRGVLVIFDINVKGYTDKHLPLQWQLLDAQTGAQISQSRDLVFVPRANDDHNTLSIWVLVPSDRDRRFFVEVQLLDNRGAIPLGRIRTNRFSGNMTHVGIPFTAGGAQSPARSR